LTKSQMFNNFWLPFYSRRRKTVLMSLTKSVSTTRAASSTWMSLEFTASNNSE
jgi:hypothetical protein